MIDSDASLDVYHHAPALHRNPVVGSLQVLAWLFLHPSAWCQYVARLDATLRPDFCFAELRRTHLHNPRLLWQLLLSHAVWFCCVAVLILVILLLTGVPGHRLLFGVMFGMGVGMAASIVVGAFISLPAGIVTGVLGGLLSGVARGVVGEGAIGTALGCLTSVMAGGIASVGITVVAAMASRQVTYPFRRRIGTVLVGIVIAAMVMSLVILIARSSAIRSLVGIPAGGIVGLAAGGVVWLRTWQGRRGLVVGLVTASLVGVACSGAIPVASSVTANWASGAAACLLFSSSFMLSYTLAERLAGPWAGAIASALGGGICLALISVDATLRPTFLGADAGRYVPLSLGVVLLGLTHALWRPVLCYPFEALWGALLYRADEQRRSDLPSLLRWQAAFWDEWQRLPLPWLDAHAVLVAEATPC